MPPTLPPAQSRSAAVAPGAGNTTTIQLQPRTMSIVQAVLAFRGIVKDDQAIRSGQFTWYAKLVTAMHGSFVALVAADPTSGAALAHVALHDPHAQDLCEDLTNLVSERDAALEKQRHAALAALEAVPAASRGPSHVPLRRMFLSVGNAKALYDGAHGEFVRGKNLIQRLSTPSAVPEDVENAARFDKHFGAASNQTILTAKELLGISSVKCGYWANDMNQHIDARTGGAGLRGLKTAAKHAAAPGSLDLAFRVDRGAAKIPGAGHVVRYGVKLGGTTDDGRKDGPVFALKRSLDLGLLAQTHVLSGIEQEGHGLEHFILLLAYDETSYGCRVVFWDPDAEVSNRRELAEFGGNGFGILHFVSSTAAKTRGGAGPLTALFSNGRFSTEALDQSIRCGSDGDHLDGIPSNDKTQHRYQVGTMNAFASFHS